MSKIDSPIKTDGQVIKQEMKKKDAGLVLLDKSY